ncbi:MAG: C25 family cysteine peptidase [bacterium]|nr:C25 family cysteine peptidase [bacterium]
MKPIITQRIFLVLFFVTLTLSIFLFSSNAVAVAGAVSINLEQKTAFKLLRSDEQSIMVLFRPVKPLEKSSIPFQTYIALPQQGIPEVNIPAFICQIWTNDTLVQTVKNDTAIVPQSDLFRLVTLDESQYIRDVRVSRLTVKPILDSGTQKKIFTELTIEIKLKVSSGNQPIVIPTVDTTVKRIGLEKILADLVLNYMESFKFRGLPALTTQTYSEYPGSIVSWHQGNRTSWACITATQSGFYKFSRSDLTHLGIDPAQVDLTRLQLFLQGKEIPLQIYESIWNDTFILFYNAPIDSPYTNTNVYWLTWQGQTGIRTEVYPLVFQRNWSGETITRIRDTIRLEENRLFEETVVAPASGNDRWFWKILKVKKPVEFVIPLYSLDTAGLSFDTASSFCQLSINFYGKSEPTGGEDHHVRIYLNQQVLDELRWAGKTEKHYTRFIPVSQLTIGMNTIQLELPGDTTFREQDEVYLNYIQLEYPRVLRTENGFLTFQTDQIVAQTTSTTDNVLAEVTLEPGLTDYFVWQLDTSGKPRQLALPITKNRLLIPIYSGSANNKYTYIVQSLSAVSTITLYRYVPRDDLRNINQQADYIIITHSLFTSIAERFAIERRNQGLTVRIVHIEDIYDQFSYGIFDPRAIRSFLQYVFYYWKKPAPNYVLLIGDASSDYLGNFANGVINYVPSYRKYIIGGDCASDMWYTEISGTDIIPDMLIGRISVNNLDDAETIFNKIFRYEQRPNYGIWRQSVLLVADDGFEENCQRLEQAYIPQAYISRHINLREFGLEDNFFLPTSVKSKISLECNRALLDALDHGNLMTIYFGHGSPNVWTHERILFGGDSKNSDMKKLTNGDKLTFVVNLTCSTGGFDYPQKPWNICISEDMHRAKSGGAVALYCPSGLGFTPQHQTMTEFLTKAIFWDNQRVLGDAIGQSVIEYAFEKKNDLMPEMFILFGDPAMNLAVPKSTFAMTATPQCIPIKQPGKVLVANQQKLPFNNGYGELTDTVNPQSFPIKLASPGFKQSITIPASDTAQSIFIRGYLADTTSNLDAVGSTKISVDSVQLDIDIQRNPNRTVGKSSVAVIITNRSQFPLDSVTVTVCVGKDTVISKRIAGIFKENARLTYPIQLNAGLNVVQVQVTAENQMFLSKQVIPVNFPQGSTTKLSLAPEEISLSPSPAVAGEVVRISIPVYNLGSMSSESTQVSLWNGQSQIDREQIIHSIPAYSSYTVSFTWNTRGKSGKQELLLRVNQQEFARFTTELYKPADVAIQPADIYFHKAKYTDGETVFILATVRNLGDVPAKQIEITGFDGDPRRGGRILDNLASWETITIPEIPGNSTYLVKLRWDAYNNAGDHELFIQLDRSNRIPDVNRENNLASKKLHIRTKPNLDITNKDIIKSPDVKTSRRVTLVATVKNIGETEAENVLIQFYDGEDKETRIAIGDEIVVPLLNAGEEYTAQVDWIVPEEKRKHNINVEVGTKQSVWKTFESLPPSR